MGDLHCAELQVFTDSNPKIFKPLSLFSVVLGDLTCSRMRLCKSEFCEGLKTHSAQYNLNSSMEKLEIDGLNNLVHDRFTYLLRLLAALLIHPISNS